MKKKNNDDVIDALLLKVEQKKKAVEQIKNPVFVTNLSFPGDILTSSPIKINLNVASEETLMSILTWLEYRLEVSNKLTEKYGLFKVDLLNGFRFEDWRDDVILKIRQKQGQKQIKELKEIEARLNNLISEKKKKDIELESLKSLLLPQQ